MKKIIQFQGIYRAVKILRLHIFVVSRKYFPCVVSFKSRGSGKSSGSPRTSVRPCRCLRDYGGLRAASADDCAGNSGISLPWSCCFDLGTEGVRDPSPAPLYGLVSGQKTAPGAGARTAAGSRGCGESATASHSLGSALVRRACRSFRFSRVMDLAELPREYQRATQQVVIMEWTRNSCSIPAMIHWVCQPGGRFRMRATCHFENFE